MKQWKKIMCILVVIVMLFNSVDLTVFATELNSSIEENTNECVEEKINYVSENSVTEIESLNIKDDTTEILLESDSELNIAESDNTYSEIEAYENAMSNSVITTTSYGTYNASASLKFASEHCTSDVNAGCGRGSCQKGWECAEFVSQCLKAGGITPYSASSTALRSQLNQSGLGIEYTVTLKNGYLYQSDCAGTISPGDVVFYYCPKHTNGKAYSVHTVLVSGFDSSGRMKAYAHHNRNMGQTANYSICYCDSHGAAITTAHVFHFNGNDSGQQPIGTVDLIQSGEGTVRVRGWAFDYDDPSAQLDIHVYVGGEGHSITANLERTDVNAAYGGNIGNYHGFDSTFNVNVRGEQQVEVYAIDTHDKWIGNPLIGSGTVNIKNIPFSITYENDSINTNVDDSTNINFNFTGDGIYTMSYEIADSSVIKFNGFTAVDWGTGAATINITALKSGNTTLNMCLLDSNYQTLFSKKIPIYVSQSVTGISLNKTKLSMQVGDEENLIATIQPQNAGNKSITWASSDKSIARVSSTGTVVAKSAGTTTITAKTNDGSYTATCNVTVKQQVMGISLAKSSTTLNVGETEQLYATITPTDATNQKIIWTSSNTGVATVNSNGVISAKAEGNAQITATTSDGGYTATCNVTVIDSLTGICFDKSSVNMYIGDAIGLKLKAIPENASLPSGIEWTSSNTNVATIDNELIIVGKSVGSTTITAKTSDGKYTAICVVNVTEEENLPTSITLSSSSLRLPEGNSHTLIATINPSNACQDVTWESSNPSVASVTNGVVTANSFGTTTIVVTTKDGGCSASCVVTVEQASIPVTGVGFSTDSITLNINESIEVQPIIEPYNATNQNVMFESSNTEIFDVTSDGILTGKTLGTALLTVTTDDGNYTETCEITIVQPVTGISLNKKSTYLTLDKTEQLVATVMPVDATDKTIVWASSNPTVATVNSEGNISPKSVGTTTISATTYDNRYTATCDVTVTDSQNIEIWLYDGNGKVGTSGYMTYSYDLNGDELQSIHWTSSDNTIISIDETTGLMQMLKPGIVTITLNINGVSATAKMKAIDIVFEEPELSLPSGEQKVLNVTVLPDMEDYSTLNWYSNNVDAATISEGIITALKEGTAIITCSYGPYTSSCLINVTAAEDIPYDTVIPVTAIMFENSIVQIHKGSKFVLEYSVCPSNAIDTSVIFESSDENIVSVTEDGTLDAKNVGEVDITATSISSGVTATCHVIVLANDLSNDDTFDEDSNFNVPEGLWITGLNPTVKYSGSAIKQEIYVYHGKTLLRENSEYKISYKNNKNAGIAQIIVTGKGNYTGKATEYFNIEAIDLSSNPDISISVATVSETGKKLKPKVTVTWNGKKLKENKDYVLSYNSNITVASKEGYDITVNGTGNYTGSVKKKFYVVEKSTPLLNNARVQGIAKTYFYENGNPVGPELDNIIVKVGKKTLTRDIDYTIRMENNNDVGTASMIIEPAQGSIWAGEKIINYKIIGSDLKNCSIVGLNKNYSYTGEEITPAVYVFSGKNGNGIKISSDTYTVSYKNNINPGKATVIVEGIEEKGFSGKITATYNIKKLDINDKNIDILLPNNSSYMKSGAKPIPIITYSFNGKVWNLREGVDYSLKYINNKSQNSSKVPTLKITGLGNFSGTIMKTYSITEQDIGYLTMTVTDKAYNANKKGSYYLVEPKIYDKDGQLLKKNKDYTVSYINMNTGKEIYKNDIIANGTEILVTASGKDNYNGTLSTSYYVRTTKDINKVVADKIINQQYTGSALKPECALYTKNGSDKIYLTEGTDYIVVGYYNNIKKGKASILIKGIGEYSGSKIVTFKIVAVNNQSIWEGIFN